MQKERWQLARARGFTLIEIMAVVVIFALLATLIVPATGADSRRNLEQAAERLVADLELARQRSVMTGIPHRLLLDLDRHSYRMEWRVDEAKAKGQEVTTETTETTETKAVQDEPASATAREAREKSLDLSPPRAELVDFYPLPSTFGRPTLLEDELFFEAVETESGKNRQGEVSVSFETDGTTEHTTIVVAHADGARRLVEILPLADAVRVLDAKDYVP